MADEVQLSTHDAIGSRQRIEAPIQGQYFASTAHLVAFAIVLLHKKLDTPAMFAPPHTIGE